MTPAKACDAEKQKSLVGGAKFEFDNLRYEKAASAYQALFDSCDDKIKKDARAGFDVANANMTTWWWLEGRYFPPLRWWRHPTFWQAVRRTLLIITVILLLLWPFFYLIDIRFFRWIAVPVGFGFRKLRQVVLVDRLPRASIMTPLALTDTTQAKLFGSMLENSSADVRRVLERAGGGLQVRATALLALPSGTTSELVDNLPKIKGIDVASWVKFFFFLKRYMGWRVESQIGFCPPTKLSDGSETPARVVASASLRHAFWVRGGPWPVQRLVQHAYDVDAIAFAIAARIMGFNMRGSRVQ